jgi:RNA-dependent RNA polymerase
VTWHQPLIPSFQNFDPQDYTAPKPLKVEKDISVDDIQNFMIDYMKGDALGLIAVSHKIHADIHQKGVRADICVELARLHSLAVDFPKTGVPADYDPKRYYVQSYPDFLNIRNKPSYESQKALGKLYRDIRTMHFNPTFNFEVNETFIVKGYDEYVADAKIVKAGFDFELQKLMKHYDIRSEFELVTQLFLDFDKKGYKKDYELRLTLSQIIRKLVDQYSRLFWAPLGGRQERSAGYDERAYQKASAWYFVAYTSTASNGNNSNANYQQQKTNQYDRILYSFPWMCVSDILLDLYKVKGAPGRYNSNATSTEVDNGNGDRHANGRRRGNNIRLIPQEDVRKRFEESTLRENANANVKGTTFGEYEILDL